MFWSFSSFLFLFCTYFVFFATFCHYEVAGEVFGELQEWMKENGADFQNKEYLVKDFKATGRGLASKQKIEKGELLFTIPFDMMLTIDKVRKTPIWPICREYDDLFWDEQQVLCLAAFLLYQKYEVQDEFWKKFIETIPKEYDTFLQYEEDDLSFLTDTALYPTAIYRKKKIQQEWEDFEEAIETYSEVYQKKKPTWDDFLWAYTSVATRTFLLYRNNNTRIGMVPLADMLNHVPDYDPSFPAWTFNNITDQFEMRSLHDVPVGQEIFTNYGDKGNDRLLSWYGFVTDSNQQDVIPVVFEPKFDDPLFELKNRLIKMVTKDEPLFIGRESLSSELLTAGRIMIIDELEVFQDKDVMDHIFSGKSIALELDYAVFNSLLKFCEGTYNNYETTEEDDKETLEMEDLPYRHKTAVKYRILERKTLKSAIELLKYARDKINETIQKRKEETTTQEEEEEDII